MVYYLWCFQLSFYVHKFIIKNITTNLSSSKIYEKENPTIAEMFEYFHWPNSSACKFAVDFGFNIIVTESVQAPDGHKAVCLDPFISPKYNECLAYSFGINNEWTFDEAMSQFGCNVYSFDPSMGLSNQEISERIHFLSIGLTEANSSQLKYPSSWNMKSLSSIYEMLEREHGAKPIDVLKMDIEFSEWDVIPSFIQSGMSEKVKQLAVEIHFHSEDSLEVFSSYYHKLRALEGKGFYRFSSRANPWLKRYIGVLGREDYIGFELAWYNSKYLMGGIKS